MAVWGVGVGGSDGGGGGGDDGGATANDGNDDDIPTARRIDHGVSLITCSRDGQTPTSNYDEQILSLVVKDEPSFRRSLHDDRCLGVEYNYAYPGPAQMLSSLPLGRPRQPATALVTPSFFFKHLGLHHLTRSGGRELRSGRGHSRLSHGSSRRRGRWLLLPALKLITTEASLFYAITFGL